MKIDSVGKELTHLANLFFVADVKTSLLMICEHLYKGFYNLEVCPFSGEAEAQLTYTFFPIFFFFNKKIDLNRFEAIFFSFVP
jgi:hypothetical protein